MTRRRDKQTIAVFLGLVLSTPVLAESMEDRTVNHLVRQAGQVEQDDSRIGYAILDDQVLTAESRHLLKVGERGRRSDRGRDSYRGRGSGHRGHNTIRHSSRFRHGSPRHYRRGRSHHHHRGYNDADQLLWFGLGVLTPYILDDRFYY